MLKAQHMSYNCLITKFTSYSKRLMLALLGNARSLRQVFTLTEISRFWSLVPCASFLFLLCENWKQEWSSFIYSSALMIPNSLHLFTGKFISTTQQVTNIACKFMTSIGSQHFFSTDNIWVYTFLKGKKSGLVPLHWIKHVVFKQYSKICNNTDFPPVFTILWSPTAYFFIDT